MELEILQIYLTHLLRSLRKEKKLSLATIGKCKTMNILLNVDDALSFQLSIDQLWYYAYIPLM
ncbi:hypothetical protein H5410_047567 [Solanum commersonii]|uniref:Uncharacterized protein n=1 Tax=Solanum commersonii TaxID=4109 RepID=A0A9J5XHD4_SOLCO|nr:hypothetical protein H5410_047567 [Solanum commersonii]